MFAQLQNGSSTYDYTSHEDIKTVAKGAIAQRSRVQAKIASTQTISPQVTNAGSEVNVLFAAASSIFSGTIDAKHVDSNGVILLPKGHVYEIHGQVQSGGAITVAIESAADAAFSTPAVKFTSAATSAVVNFFHVYDQSDAAADTFIRLRVKATAGNSQTISTSSELYIKDIADS